MIVSKLSHAQQDLYDAMRSGVLVKRLTLREFGHCPTVQFVRMDTFRACTPTALSLILKGLAFVKNERLEIANEQLA
jgi:hypothetical protein